MIDFDLKAMVNTTSQCPLPDNWQEFSVSPVKVAGPFTLQHLLFLFSIACAGLTTIISLFLIMKHLHRYTNPKQQRQIVRIIFTPVVFATLSAISILSYSAAQYMQPLTALYEAFALASLFLLMVEYVAPDENTRAAFFENLECHKPKSQWLPSKGYNVVPGGSGPWYRVSFAAVFLYVIIDTLMTVIELVTEALGRYCEQSWSPKFGHIWVEIITNIFLGAAITKIVGFYGRFRNEPTFSMHKPGLKLISFKLIVFINFIQSIIFSILLSHIKTSRKLTGYDLKYGIPAALVAFEQILFAIFFHYSFRSREYHESMKEDLVTPRMGTFRAAANAFNPSDLLIGMVTAVKLLFGKIAHGGNAPAASRGRQMNYQSGPHLEPMSQQPLREPSPYQRGPSVDESNIPPYSNYTGAKYSPPPYPPAALQDGNTNYASETANLNPYAYARTHSRDPSVDATSTRQMV